MIINSPPRLTTSHIQAMCASTHLLIPTILDGLSGDAVARYLDQVAAHKLGSPGDAESRHLPPLATNRCCLHLVTNPDANLDGRLNELRSRIAAARSEARYITQRLLHSPADPIPRITRANLIAYASTSNDKHHQDLREEVDELGDWIAPRSEL